jgi:hypothetical protein
MKPEVTSAGVVDVDQLSINGLFGHDPGTDARGVTVNGVQVPVVSWAPEEIVVQLDSSSAGDVVVEIDPQLGPHTSNVARLTAWQGQFLNQQVGAGSTVRTGTFNLLLRADIRQYRLVIHRPPPEPMTMPSQVQVEDRDSTGRFDSMGSRSEGTTVYSLSGSGNLFPFNELSADNYFWTVLNVADSRTLLLSVVAGSVQGLTCTEIHFDGTTYTYPTPFLIGTQPPLPTLSLDASSNILAGSGPDNDLQFDLCGFFYSSTFTWPFISGQYPPDPMSAR